MKVNTEGHRITHRIVDVLEKISSSIDGYTMTEICQEIHAPKSSMFPILKTLVDRKVLFIDKNAKYKIGSLAYKIGNSYLQHFNFMEEIEKITQDIVNICAEACHFAILVDGDVFYLKKTDSPEPIRMVSTIGKRIPAYGTALGKALLMDHTINEIKALYPNGLVSLTDNTITDFSVLEEQLHKAQIEGITYEIEESNKYIRCLSVPIRKKGKIVAAISVAIPTFRHNNEKESMIKMLLTDSKNKLEQLLKPIDIDFSDLI